MTKDEWFLSNAPTMLKVIGKEQRGANKSISVILHETIIS